MTSITVRAVPWRDGWELHIDDLHATQCETLDDAEAQVRSYLAVTTGQPADDVKVHVVVDEL